MTLASCEGRVVRGAGLRLSPGFAGAANGCFDGPRSSILIRA